MNKAFILATAGAYFGLALAALLNYPTIVGVSNQGLVWGYLAAGIVFLLWVFKTPVPVEMSYLLGIGYGLFAAVTFIGLENWGNQQINLAMALWDLACAVCFLVE